ncbi:MAG TPA: CIA30 family protein [Steroidobacteraceae bacterium]|nr:CIA30 family protein [Steroidobacteraceae bacterium]
MSTTTAMSTGRILAAYATDIRFELTKMLRTPAFALPTLLFPAMFYLIFGVLIGAKNGPAEGLGTFARLTVFGTMAPGLFGFGVSLAFEREYGTLIYKQALPMPHGSYLLARMVMAMMFAAIISTLMILLAVFAAHVPMTAGQIAQTFLVQVLGVLPFCALGLMVGAYASGQAAPALVNLIYIPMSFLSGLWVPLQFLPKFLQQLAPVWPSFHLSQLALGAVGRDQFGATSSHVLALLGVTLLCFTIAMRKLGSGGMRLLGGKSTSGGTVSFARRVGGLAAIAVSIALFVAGVSGGTAKVVAAPAGTSETASAATDAAASLPAGVPAPADTALSDFDHGSDRTPYGEGWHAGGDETRGGNSHATQKVVDGALVVSGTVGDAIAYPFAGTVFFPSGYEPGRFMDYSGKHTLSFRARGDGHQYTVAFLSGVQVDAIPAMVTFTAGSDWTDVKIDLDSLAALDRQRVHGIVIGSLGPPGDFRFEIDDVELR